MAGFNRWLARVSLTRTLLFWCGGALLLNDWVSASSWVSMSIDAMIEEADVVVRGRIVAKNAEWLLREGPSRIVTFYDVEVDELLNGQLTASEQTHRSVRFGVLGGEVGAYGQYVHGAPHLAEGASVVAFLGAPDGPQGARGVLGFNQGILLTDSPINPAASSSSLIPLNEAFEDEARSAHGRRQTNMSLKELRQRCARGATP